MSFAAFIRRLVQPDASTAYEAEARVVRAAVSRPALDPRFRAEMLADGKDRGRRITLGHALREPSLPVSLPIADLTSSHALLLGATGAGKTRLAGVMLRELVRIFAHDPRELGVMVLDHKGDLVELARGLVAERVRSLGHDARERLLRRLVVIDPFSMSRLVPFDLLARDASVSIEEQAYECASLVDHLTGDELGAKQHETTYHLCLLGVSRGLSLPIVHHLLHDPDRLRRVASASPSVEVRSFFAEAKLAGPSLDGVRARLGALLRVPSCRLMLGANGSVSFGELLSSKLTLIDVGSPPLGCEDLARFWAGAMTAKLVRATFARGRDDARRPVIVLIDEWAEGLSRSSGAQYDRSLRMSRSKGVHLLLMSQSLTQAAKIDASLPKVVQTNTGIQLLGRASIEDARAMAPMLPITTRVRRGDGLPWEPRAKGYFLTASEEREALVTEVPSLPRRVFYYWNRSRPYGAQLVRAAECDPPRPGLVSRELAERLRHGGAAIPVADLERLAAARMASAVPAEPAALVGPTRRPKPIKS